MNVALFQLSSSNGLNCKEFLKMQGREMVSIFEAEYKIAMGVVL